MSKELMMQRFLLEHGWVKHGATGWVKKEWNTVTNNDNYLPIDEAYLIAKIDNAKSDYNNHTKLLLENIILDAIEGGRWGDHRSAVKGFVKGTLYEWYLSLCDGDENPVIHKTFNPTETYASKKY